jgi:hypothetical protein
MESELNLLLNKALSAFAAAQMVPPEESLADELREAIW